VETSRITRVLGLALAGICVAVTISRVYRTYAAIQAEGLRESDRDRIWSIGIEEAAYVAAIMATLAAALLYVSWWLRRRERGSPERR
jgi:hypothetical protein